MYQAHGCCSSFSGGFLGLFTFDEMPRTLKLPNENARPLIFPTIRSVRYKPSLPLVDEEGLSSAEKRREKREALPTLAQN